MTGLGAVMLFVMGLMVGRWEGEWSHVLSRLVVYMGWSHYVFVTSDHFYREKSHLLWPLVRYMERGHIYYHAYRELVLFIITSSRVMRV